MIKIQKSETADTRTCDTSKVTKDVLLNSSRQHISDVQRGMLFLVSLITSSAHRHDHTKVSHIDDFYRDFKNNFETQDWYKMHQETERHHLKDIKYVQDDVNLIDILEMITDGVMAGLARSGEYRKAPIPVGLLEKAFDNTIKLMLENVEVDNG